MKKLLFVLLFCASVAVQAQHTNAVYLVGHPINIGGGVRIDQNWITGGNALWGIYASFVAGSYHQLDDTHINQHYKAAIGYIYYMPIELKGVRPIATIGASYSVYRGVSQNVKKSFLFPLSCEIGLQSNVDHFVYGLRVDPFKQEVSLDFGFKFNLIQL